MEGGGQGRAGPQYKGKGLELGTSTALMVSGRWVRSREYVNSVHWDSPISEMVQVDSEVMGVVLV